MCSAVVAELVSLPSHSLESKPFPLLLPPELREQYANPDTFRSVDDTVWRQARDTKAALLMPHKQYARLLLRLYQIRMIRFLPVSQIQVRNGLMCVWKDAISQRLIFNGRAANYVLQPPPHVELPHPTDLSRLQLLPHQSLLPAKMDMDSYYHRLSVPEWLVPILALPILNISQLRSLRQQLIACTDGCPISEEISPAALTLPTGLSHSVLIAQAIHLHLLRSAQLSVPHSLPNEPLRAQTNALSCVYIDNHFLAWRVDYSTVSETKRQAQILMEQLALRYQSQRLPLNSTKSEGPTYVLTFLGVTIDGAKGLLLPQPTTLTNLMLATRWILALPSLSFKLLQRLVGHWVWLLLLRRPVFSVLFATYRYLAAYSSPASQQPLWVSVRLELSFPDGPCSATIYLIVSSAIHPGLGCVFIWSWRSYLTYFGLT